VREEEENPALFAFLYNAMITFDQQEQHFENFHLVFLLELSQHLGFGPGSGKEIIEQVAFSSNAQTATAAPPVLALHAYETYFEGLLRPDSKHELIPNGKVRREMLSILIRYYQLHVDKLGEIKSLAILSEVLG